MKKFAFTLIFVMLLAGSGFAAEVVKAYTTMEEPLAKALFDEFEAETGIKVEWVRLSGGEAIARLEAEKANPQASIWVGGVGTQHIEAKLRGLSTPYRSRMASSIPARYRDPENYWTGLYVGPIAFCMNTERAKELGLEMPKSWADLIKPEYSKKVRVAHPSTSGTAYNMITTVIRIFNGDEDKAFAYFKELAKSVEQFTRSGSAPGKSCALGEIPIAIGYLHDQVKLRKEGAKIEIVIPEDGTGFETASMSILKDGPDPLNAKKLYDWVLGQKAMDIIARWYVIPLSKLAAATETGFSLDKMNLVNQDDQWDAANKERLLERWNKEISTAPEK
ncbi:MAG: ABC transporter substrate-binding protein [Synergistaceae bacterium]|nr:ABC transporter substrate-binding protein [Synergistaceae bacterium]MBQ9594606.1 ABC transporter substrate-binding protein [Synergistaceae bacterium]MBR0204772.1 ABC transporter substrate-binding protein [Synergistaceae bacterium]